MEIVNEHANKLKTRSAAWKLHAELIAFEGTPEEVDAYCKKRLTEEGGDKPKQKGVRIGRAIDSLRTISSTDTQQKITELEKALDVATANEYQPRSEALLEPFRGLVEGNGAGEKVSVALSDSTTMTGAELLNAAMEGALCDKLYIGLFHPTEGQVNLYETRFASDKLRTARVPSLRSSATSALPCWF